MQDLKVPADYSPERDGTALVYFGDDPCFPCHPTGQTWNGFDNVRVSPQVRDVIAAAWRADGDEGGEDSSLASLLEIQPDSEGLIDLGNGFATELDPCNLQAVLDAGFRFVPQSDPPLELETVAGFDSELQRVTWGLCRPNAGDTLFDLSTHLTEAEQEVIANQIAAAFAPRQQGN